jgi:hypothetical protein
MQITLQRFRGKDAKTILDHDFDGSPFSEVDIDETGKYLISVSLEADEEILSAKLHNLEMNITSWGNDVVLDIEDTRTKEYQSLKVSEDYAFFTFRNRAGRVTLDLQSNRGNYAIYCDVEPKYPNYLGWYNAVFLQFPLTRNPSSLGSASMVRSTLSNNNFFYSRFDFFDQITKIIEKINSGVFRQGYLKTRYDINTIERGMYGRPDKAVQMVKENRVTWQRAPLSSQSLARVGIQSFEPQVFAKQTTTKNFDNEDNRRLLAATSNSAQALSQQAAYLKKEGIHIHEVRGSNVSVTEQTTSALAEFVSKMGQMADKLRATANRLMELGIKDVALPSIRDPRYSVLHQDVDDLEFWLSALVSRYGSGTVWTGQPDLSQLFEFFCYSQIIEALKDQGFLITESGDDVPVPYFIRLKNPDSELQITILYDQEIAGKTEISEGQYAPVVCNLGHRPQMGWFRPDFTIIFEKNGFSTFAILDAKYKAAKKAKRDVAKLSAKYIPNLVSNALAGKMSMYIGALCLPGDDDDLGTGTHMPHELALDGERETFTNYGFHLMPIGKNGTSDLLQKLCQKFERLFTTTVWTLPNNLAFL